MSEKEIRTLSEPIKVELRDNDENENDSRQYVVGYALRFNSESEDLGGFIEKIEPTALTNTDLSDVRALINHDPSQVLGRTTSGTLKLSVDELGLRYEIDMPDTSYANDIMKSMTRGDINESSFGFIIDYENEGDSWEYDEKRDIYLRSIKSFKKLTDISIVTYPAYKATESVVASRSLEAHKNELARELKKRKLAIELELL